MSSFFYFFRKILITPNAPQAASGLVHLTLCLRFVLMFSDRDPSLPTARLVVAGLLHLKNLSFKRQ